MTIQPHDPLARELYAQIGVWPIYDPHSHIDPHRPAARDLDEVLGYHYYTELCHSAGMPAQLVAPSLTPRDRARNLANHIDRIDNTIQYSWLLEIAEVFHGFTEPGLTPGNVDVLYDRALRSQAQGAGWDEEVWKRSNLATVFLTNDFDDPLEGWDRSRYVPCLRTDDLVLKLHEPRTLERLQTTTGLEVGDAVGLERALGVIFDRFVTKGARACAISLPPDFAPHRPAEVRARTPLRRALHGMELRPDEHADVQQYVFWALAEKCADHRLPFDLMIGPIRNVYPAGVAGGRDLYDRLVSLHAYRDLFNHFADVTFPVSTLAPDAAGELVSFAWIFPNVVPMGHWWYSNLPAFIARDLEARLQGVPKVKQVGYYSDAYKLEFILPKFNMYRSALSEVLASACVRGRGWPADRALEMARLVLVDNPKRVFARPGE